MDLIALAVPFFLLALLLEVSVDRWRGTGYYRLNDAINSLSTGTLSTTIGYFTRLLPVLIWGSVLQHLALFSIDPALFDLSARGLLLWLLALLAFDFCYYWAHRFGHEISILWAAHAVHHQSEDYNLSTALRQTSTGFLFSWIFYLPLFLIGLPLSVVVTVNAIDLIYQFWVHTQHIRKLGWLDRLFVTPSNHRVHHAQNEIYIDRNYGGILIVWDRLFGTFQEERDDEPVVFGVRKPLASWNPFWANVQVYDDLWRDARRTRRWRDKLGIWFRRTGWRPADVSEGCPESNAGIDSFTKYDPPLGLGMQRYLLAQFLAAVIAILWIGTVFAAEGASAVLLPCALLWFSLYVLGLLNDRRPSAIRTEQWRLTAVVPLGVALLYYSGLVPDAPPTLVTATAAYVAISWFGLQRARAGGEQHIAHAA
ncbi:MAG: sterol desaturase family protein [Woeseia sp.]